MQHLMRVGEIVEVLAGQEVDALNVQARLLQGRLGLLSDLHKGLLDLHGIEAVLGGNDVLGHLWAAMLACDGSQAVHRPAGEMLVLSLQPHDRPLHAGL